jgi:hypothetical protein
MWPIPRQKRWAEVREIGHIRINYAAPHPPASTLPELEVGVLRSGGTTYSMLDDLSLWLHRRFFARAKVDRGESELE